MGRTSPSRLTSGNRRLVLLAPEGKVAPSVFNSPVYELNLYDEMLAGVQRLRGATYVNDGAIRTTDLTPDGRHISPVDTKAWHVLVVDSNDEVCGCARYLAYDRNVSFSDLMIQRSALAEDPEWGPVLRRAVESEIELARALNMTYVEVGGWALNEQVRFSSEALRIALGTYALSRNLGGCIGVSTVTVRHCSASILQRIGGSVLDHERTTLPLYYDPQYQCDMSILRFEAHHANPRYERAIEDLRAQLENTPVYTKLPVEVYRRPERAVFACA